MTERDVQRITVSLPFFHIDDRFGCSVQEIILEAAREPPSRGAIRTFKMYRRHAATERKNGPAQYLRQMVATPIDDDLLKFEDRDDFLRQLPSRYYTKALFDKYLDEFRSLTQAILKTGDADSARAFCTREVPGVILQLARCKPRWSSKQSLAAAGSLEVVVKDTYDQLRDFAAKRILNAAHIQVIVALGFLCLAASKVLGIRNNSVLDWQMYIWRNAGVTWWASLPGKLAVDHALVVLQLALEHFPDGERLYTRLGFSTNVFSNLREIIVDARDRLRDPEYTIEKVVFDFFATKINQDVFVRFGYSEPSILLRSLSAGEHGIISDFAYTCHSYRYSVTIDRVYAFLAQFAKLEIMQAVIRVLPHIRYIPLARMGELVEDSISSAKSKSPYVVVPLGDLDGSASIVRYLATHSSVLGDDIVTTSVEDALRNTDSDVEIFFADDSCLSGTQCLHTVEELLGQRKLKPHHTKHADPLPPNLRSKLRRRRCSFCFGVATDFGLARAKRELGKLGFNNYGLCASHIESVEEKIFSTKRAWIWRSRSEMEECQNLLTHVGYELLARRASEKNWTEDRRRESALGFSDFQRLLVFEYNTPKTTLTALWEQGEVDGKKWVPLFPGAD